MEESMFQRLTVATKRLEEISLIPEVSVRDSYSVSEVRRQITKEKEEVIDDTKYEEIKLDFEVFEEKEKYDQEIDEKIKEELPFDVEEEKKSRIKKMIPRGVVLLTYIVAENEDGMYLIDQHAAAERINYEKILKQMKEKPIIIDLLIPIRIELRKDEYILAKERFSLLCVNCFVKNMSIETKLFIFTLKNTIIIRSHPAWIPEDRSEAIIREIVDLIVEKGNFDFDQFVWRMAATTACRMSVMAGDYISLEDQEWILENIRYCDNPFTCPHGRPTIITYTKYELEKLFKRQLD